MAIVRYEGTEIKNIPESIASDDAKLRSALVTVWPAINRAEIARSRENGVLIVTAAKKADYKGSAASVVKALLSRGRRERSPFATLLDFLKSAEANSTLTPRALSQMEAQIEQALKLTSTSTLQGEVVVNRLAALPARAAHSPASI